MQWVRDNTSFYLYFFVMILFFDTETTWLPSDYNSPISDIENRPRIVQLAWCLCDDKWLVLRERNHIVKPKWYTIPDGMIHWISQQKADDEWLPLWYALLDFMFDVSRCSKIVAHNMSFDHHVVWCEVYRLLKDDNIFQWKEIFCTMMQSIEICKIESKYWYKYPKLQELYTHLFNKEFEWAHDALYDVKACIECYFEITK